VKSEGDYMTAIPTAKHVNDMIDYA